MARVAINTGATPNDGTGDNLRAAGGIINNNFLELYTYLGAGSTDTLSVPLWNTTASGINTLRNVGLGTTNPRFALEVGSVGASGTSLWVNGDARITGILTIGTSSITLNGSSNTINVGSGITINGNTGIISATSIVVGGTTLTGSAVTSITAGSGISINQSTGNVTITATGGGGGESYWTSTTAGINTLSKVGIGTTNPTSTLTVKGNTSLETLSVSGVSTFSDIYLGNGSAYLVYSGSNVVFTQPSGTDGSDDVGGFKFVTTDPGLPSSYETALSIYSAGSYWDRLVKVHRSLQVDNNITVNGTSTFAGITTVTGNTLFTKQLSVSGIATISGDGTNAYLRYGSSNAYTNFVTTYNVSQVGGVSLISADANGVALSADTTLNAAYWRIRTLPTGAEVNGALNVSGVSTLTSNVSIGGTVSVSGGVKLATNNATIVGTSGTAGEIKQIGGAPFYYDGSAWREFVLSSGTPVTVPADTEWDNVILRSTYNTNYDDAKFGISPSFVGTAATIVSAPVKIGTGAFRNDGTIGLGVSFNHRSDYDFTGPWTIEFWCYHDSAIPANGNGYSLVSKRSTLDTSGNWSFYLENNGVNHYWIWNNENGTAQTLFALSNSNFTSSFVDTWVHYALVREADNGSIHFYIDGVEKSQTINDAIIDNDILNITSAGLYIGGTSYHAINGTGINYNGTIDAIFDDLRITTDARYTSVGSATTVFTPPETALPTTGTLSSYVQPPGDKYGEITLGGSPTWRGTSGVTVSQQSSGNYRVSFASSYTNANDYYVLSQGMDQGFASYVGIARSTTHVDLSINKQSDDTAVNTGSLAVQIKNHI